MKLPGSRTSSGRIAVLGTKEMTLRLTRSLVAARLRPAVVVTWDDSHDSRSRLTDLQALCVEEGLPIAVVRRSTSAYKAILDASPSVVLVAGWYQLIPDDILASVPHGFVGAHYSALPRYRGSAPVVWQLINGEREIGYSLFRLSHGMDEGDLAAQGYVEADEGYVGEVLDRLNDAAIAKLVQIAPALARGTHAFSPQPAIRPSYASMRRPEDGRINWTRSADAIVNAIRAQSRPYPGAWTELSGETVTVWRAYVEESADYSGVPGQVVRIIDRKPVVACGTGGVVLEEWEGKQLGLTDRLT